MSKNLSSLIPPLARLHSPPAVLLPLQADDGRPLHAHITLDDGPDVWSVIVESRGGKIGTKSARNPGYAVGLRTILGRLGAMRCVVLDALVASREVSALADKDRRVDGLEFPISLSTTSDIGLLAASLQRGQRDVGAAAEAKGGNTTKRLLLKVMSPTALTTEQMASRLARAAAMGHVQPEALAEAAADLEAEGHFDPHGQVQGRRLVMRAIADRQGQPAFRRRVLKAYAHRCAFTGCMVERVLDAAHILPYNGPATNHVQNGLLLRTDVHTLFDLGLVGVDPNTWSIVTHADLAGTEYAALYGRAPSLPADKRNRPSIDALTLHLQAADLAPRRS